jgi:hypothetical protein
MSPYVPPDTCSRRRSLPTTPATVPLIGCATCRLFWRTAAAQGGHGASQKTGLRKAPPIIPAPPCREQRLEAQNPGTKSEDGRTGQEQKLLGGGYSPPRDHHINEMASVLPPA